MKNIDSNLLSDVTEAVNHALYDALCKPTRYIRGKIEGEPNLVANLVCRIPQYLNTINAAGFSVKTGGVFVHQRPYVEWGARPSRCEIGDLLLLRREIVNGQSTQSQALLLQAKKISFDWDGCPDPTRPDQHTLYNSWPRFNYSHHPGGQREISDKDIYTGTKYLLFGDTVFPCSCCYPFYRQHVFCHCPHSCSTAMPTQPVLSFYHCFADELIQFIFGLAGKSYQTPAADDIGWNKIIEDLITRTKDKLIAKSGTARIQGMCIGNESISFLMNRDISHIPKFPNNGINDGDPQFQGESEDGGIPVIEFTVLREEPNQE